MIRKILLIVLPLTVLACGGLKDQLLLDGDYFPWETENNSSNSGNGEASTVVVDTHNPEDSLATVSFDRTIAITFSTTGSATVSGDAHGVVSVSGNGVTVNNTSYDEKVRYELSGTTTDGFFKLYSTNKQAVVLKGVNITNRSGAPINIQSHKRTFIVMDGNTTLTDGASYSGTPSGEDEKAAVFGEGQLIFSGSGSLTVTATGGAGITSDDYLRFMDGPAIRVNSSAGHGLRGKDAVIVSAGNLDITVSAAGKKGISSDGAVTFDGGQTKITVSGGVDSSDSSDLSGSAGIKTNSTFTINDGSLAITNSGQGGKGMSVDLQGYFYGGNVRVDVSGSNYGSSSSGGGPGGFPGGWGSSSSSDNSVAAKGLKFDGNLLFAGSTVTVTAKNHEAIESKGTLDITGGIVYAQSYDDAINAGSHLTISGGLVCALSTGNDGLDANGNMYIKGGVIYSVAKGSPEVALDANTERGYKLYFSGGTLFALGGLEGGSQLTQTCYSASWNKNTWYAMTVGENTYAFKTPSSGGSGLVVSGATKPELVTGATLSGGETIFEGIGQLSPAISGGTAVSLSNYTNSGGRPGGW